MKAHKAEAVRAHRGVRVAALVGLGLVACGGAKPANTGRTIGSAGGVVMSSDGRARIAIPAGALTSPTAITITPVSSPAPGALGQVWEIGPTGTQFATPVSITLAYSDADLAGHSRDTVAVSTVVAGRWQALASSVIDVSAHTGTGLTTHLSSYALATQGSASDGGVPASDGGVPPGDGGTSCTDSPLGQLGNCECPVPLTVPTAGYYFVTNNAYQNGNTGPYSNDLYRIGSNAGEQTAYVGSLHTADGTRTNITHVAEDPSGSLFGLDAASFFRIDPASLVATPLFATTTSRNLYYSMFSPGSSGGTTFVLLWANTPYQNVLYCFDANHTGGVELLLPTSMQSNYDITGLTGSCTVAGTYHITVVGHPAGTAAYQFFDILQNTAIPPYPGSQPPPVVSTLSQTFPGGAGMTADGMITFGKNQEPITRSLQSLGPRYLCGGSGVPIYLSSIEGG